MAGACYIRAMQSRVLLAARDVVVRYGPTLAVDAVDLDIVAGEVHAVVGENGAGKSTLLRAVAHIVTPDSGSIRVHDEARLAWVPQETVLPPDLTAAEWIFLGCELRGPLGWLHRRRMENIAAAELRKIGCPVSPTTRLGALAAPQRKQVQLARGLRGRPDLLLLDEPTAVLGEAETQRLFAVVRDLKRDGTGVLYVSHRLDEVLAIADRVTVLRDGRRISTDPVAAVGTRVLVERMVGREVTAQPAGERATGGPVLQLTDVATGHVQGVSLEVRRGEIVGLAGLVGAGRSEVLEAVAGLRPLRSGNIACAETPLFVPEDRAAKGLVPTLGVRDNLFLPADGWFLRRRRETSDARRWIEALRIRARDPEARIDSLSGGNQQKLLLARALRHQPKLILLDEPTAGIDVGAKAEIHELIRRRAAAGTAVLLASSDLPELLLLCDRIVAMREGRAVGVVPVHEATEARLATMITGAGHE